MSKKIILSADQSCDLGPVLQEKFGVEYIPTTIILEDKEYIDNETITADDIYRAYWDRKVLPKNDRDQHGGIYAEVRAVDPGRV